MNSLQGHFLVASPHLLDENFVKTVILLVQHTDQGAFGVVINRPTTKTVGELWDEVGQSQCDSRRPVYLGGPVPGPLMAVHTDRSLAEIDALPEVFVAMKKDDLDELVRQKKHPFKVFVGHAGWSAGQLELELEEGAWFTAPATIETIFNDRDDLWECVSRRVGESVLEAALHLKTLPADPTMN
ncbi:MAG TPA: YqgE/AlgH family protein [Thermoguttaceae bacterium]|nr:YqgE/AlgH family protein [Thermoguttaceae bacterium]